MSVCLFFLRASALRRRPHEDLPFSHGSSGHPAGLHPEEQRPQHQGSGFPPPAHAEGDDGTLSGHPGGSAEPGADPERLQGDAKILCQNR